MLTLSIKSLCNRRFVVVMTVLSIALSVALVLGVERLRTAAKSGFANSAAGIDLIVAPRGDQVQILMATVFGIGSTGPGISWTSYEAVASRPAVAWAVPVSLGDNHRGFPVIGTTADYFDHLRHSGGKPLAFARGRAFAAPNEAVVGAEIAARFGYAVGRTIINAHGAGEVAFDVHDEAPFTITGILAPTGTAVDRLVLVSLEGFDRLHAAPDAALTDPFEALPDAAPVGMVQHPGDGHAGHDDHADAHDHHTENKRGEDQHNKDAQPNHTAHKGSDHDAHAEDVHDAHAVDEHGAHQKGDHGALGHVHEPDKINAIYVGLEDRGAILSIQRFVTEYQAEPLTAVLPNVALLQLWSITGVAENTLLLMAFAVALAGIVGMVVMLSASLDARRREFAILRSVGATPARVFSLILLEATLVTAAGILLGYGLMMAASLLAAPALIAQFGVRLAVGLPGPDDFKLMSIILVAGILASTLPAIRVYRMTLADGLSFRI